MQEINEEMTMFANETPSIDEAITFAIDAIDRGDLKLGNAALGWVLQREPENNVAWLWMACTVPDEQAKRGCYSRIAA
jgi:hypothetical protein